MPRNPHHNIRALSHSKLRAYLRTMLRRPRKASVACARYNRILERQRSMRQLHHALTHMPDHWRLLTECYGARCVFTRHPGNYLRATISSEVIHKLSMVAASRRSLSIACIGSGGLLHECMTLVSWIQTVATPPTAIHIACIDSVYYTTSTPTLVETRYNFIQAARWQVFQQLISAAAQHRAIHCSFALLHDIAQSTAPYDCIVGVDIPFGLEVECKNHSAHGILLAEHEANAVEHNGN